MKPYRIGFVAMLVVCMAVLTTCDIGEEYIPEDDPCADAREQIILKATRVNIAIDEFTNSKTAALDYYDYDFVIPGVCASSVMKFEFNSESSPQAVIDAFLYVNGKAIRLNRKILSNKNTWSSWTFGNFSYEVEGEKGAQSAEVKVKVRFRYDNNKPMTDLEFLQTYLYRFSWRIKYWELK